MSIPVNKIICGDWIEVAETLPSGLVHCIITSPPYWGQRNYGVEGQLGLEKIPDCGLHGFMRLRKDLSKDEILYVARQLMDEDVCDVQDNDKENTK